MKIDTRFIMRHPNGVALMSSPDEKDKDGKVTVKGEPMTVGDILVHVALQPGQPNKPYTSREQVMRYTLALNATKAKENAENGELYISRKMIKVIEDDLNRIYTPVAAGQLLVLMGYQPEDDEEGDELDPEEIKARALAGAKK